jgi:hypothetical protein
VLVNVRWRLGLGIMGARFIFFMVLMVWYLAERKKL